MSKLFACLTIAGLALAANPCTSVSASPAPYPEVVDLLVNGVPQPRFAHEGRLYVEALKGREYAIRIRNPYGVRAAVALSVDGLNTIDARQTTAADARKWVLAPYETVTISGWQTSRTEARRFEFTTEARSYGQALGKTANLGVISAVFFKERGATVSRDAERARSAVGQTHRGRQRRPGRSPPRPETRKPWTSRRHGHGPPRPVTPSRRYGWISKPRRPRPSTSGTSSDRSWSSWESFRSPPFDPLQRRERARGFEPGFSPVVP